MNREAVIVAACRTAVVPRGGAFRAIEVHDLGAHAVRACLARAGLAPDAVDEVIAGNALGAGGNPARLIALAASLPERVAGLTIDRQCCGGLDAILLARAMIASGAADVVVAGGAETYSRRPLRLRTSPDGGPPQPYDQPSFSPWPDRDPDMHEAAARLAATLGVGRGEQDAWAVASHVRASKARETHATDITAVEGVAADAYTRAMTPRLAARAPTIHGTISTANAAVAADAAAFCVLTTEAIARTLNRPVVRIAGGTTLGAAPEDPGLAPVPAIAQALAEAGLRPGALGSSEIMEAYAVQAIACVRGAGLDPAKVNPDGGALARGHPIGASGAILAVRAVNRIAANPRPVLAAIAAAGGLGTAAVFTP